MTYSPQINPLYANPTDEMKRFMARFVNPSMTLCEVYTPKLGLNMGMEYRARHGSDFNNDFNNDFGP